MARTARNRGTRKHQVRFDTVVRCKQLQEEMTVEKCLDRFVEANAFDIRESPCFKCQQGQRLRASIARS